MNLIKNIKNLRFTPNLYTIRSKLKSSGVSAVTLETKTDAELVPSKPVEPKLNLILLPPRTEIDVKTIALLERLSLVDCSTKEGIQVLEDAIEFADQILQVNTRAVDPLVTVLEDRPLEIREDVITEGNIRDAILSNASITEEEYLVAPPGNIPLESRENLLHEDTEKKSKI